MSVLENNLKNSAAYDAVKSTYSKMKNHIKRQRKEEYDKARTSNKPSHISWYIKEFDKHLNNAELAELERMLDCHEYEVTYDSSNDYFRRYKLEERIQLLRNEQEKQVESARKEFTRWLEASKSDIDILEAGLSNRKYHICYDSENDDARRLQLEEELRPLREKRKEEYIEMLNNLNKLGYNTTRKLEISQSIICLRTFKCRKTLGNASSQSFSADIDADENLRKYEEAQKRFFEVFCKYEAEFETIYDLTDSTDKSLLGNVYLEAARYCRSIGSEKAELYYEKAASLGNENAVEFVNVCK